MAEVVLVSTSRSVDEESVRFEVRCYLRYAAPFVVLAPGDDDTRLTVSDPAHLVRWGGRSPKSMTCWPPR
jgi:hypothetical protein